ncbi:hypothetical protein F5148DRAFT_1281488 [Russula earlei]|uniref:Uncharacterized protein n=1 Tax=Russula earlei TaxID=71964 RepID=A0ACC0UHT0_9AGAM|nr:hypothetical protein F5148DRAFT_1281488 [Russula earlei]
MRAFKFAAIFSLAIGIVPSFALPSGDAPNPILASRETVWTSPREGIINANILSKRASGDDSYYGDAGEEQQPLFDSNDLNVSIEGLTTGDWRERILASATTKEEEEELNKRFSKYKRTKNGPPMRRKKKKGEPSGKMKKS